MNTDYTATRRDGSTFQFSAPDHAFDRYLGTLVVGESWPRWRDVAHIYRADGKVWSVVQEVNDLAMEFTLRGAPLPA